MIAPPTKDICLPMNDLPPQALVQVAGYFQALADPTRLRILNLLRAGERGVGELAELCGYSAANVSRHLATLAKHGLVARESRGPSAYYRIADESVYSLCDLVCGNIGRQLERRVRDSAVFVRRAKAGRTSTKTK
jgi:DNA-binding transcriptional ArsR family regulator